MITEKIHNFYRPWYYTTFDLERKNLRGQPQTGAYIIDDFIFTFDMVIKRNAEPGDLIEKMSNIKKLFADYSEFTETNRQELKESQPHIIDGIEDLISHQKALLKEIDDNIGVEIIFEQTENLKKLLASLSDTVISMTEKLFDGYLNEAAIVEEKQCSRCNFTNTPLTLQCISCSKTFILGQNELMTEMILNLGIHEEKNFRSGLILTNNKVSDFFFKYLMFMSEKISMEEIIKEFDILELTMKKTKIKAEKTLYTISQLELIDEVSAEGWSFIDGLNKISSKLALIRDSLYSDKQKDPQKLWTEVIDGMRMIKLSSHFYQLLNENFNES